MFEREHEAAKIATRMVREDWLMRSIIQSCVAFAMEDHGPIDPERADSDAHDMATRAVAIAVARMTSEDGLLASMTAQRDAYKKMASELMMLIPPRNYVLTIPKTEEGVGTGV